MRLGEMSKEHIVELARYELSLTDEEICDILIGDGTVTLFWESYSNNGSIVVDEDNVCFSSDAFREPYNASIDTLRFIAGLGYDIL